MPRLVDLSAPIAASPSELPDLDDLARGQGVTAEANERGAARPVAILAD